MTAMDLIVFDSCGVVGYEYASRSQNKTKFYQKTGYRGQSMRKDMGDNAFRAHINFQIMLKNYILVRMKSNFAQKDRSIGNVSNDTIVTIRNVTDGEILSIGNVTNITIENFIGHSMF